MKMENKSIRLTFTGILTTAAVYFDMLAVPVLVLIAAMAADYITGMTVAWFRSEISSRRGIKGIVTKVCYMALVAVAMGVDYILYGTMALVNIELPQTTILGLLVTIWLIINEMISILENLSKIGVPIPPFLTKVIRRLKISTENKGEES